MKNSKNIRSGAVQANELKFVQSGKDELKILNLTGHEIYAQLDGFEKTVFFPPRTELDTPRVLYAEKNDGFIGTMEALHVQNIPPILSKVVYLVSRETLRVMNKLYPKRNDFIAPGKQIREAGTKKVLACKNFIRNFS